MILRELRDFLDSHLVRYAVCSHSRTFTAAETARAAHVDEGEFAKVTIVRIDRKLAMAVVPATNDVDLARLQALTNAGDVALAHEGEFSDRFPDCEVGAMPPFGNLFDMDCYVEESMRQNTNVAFNAGSHAEVLQMRFRDFQTLTSPTFAHIACDHEQ